MKNTKNKLDMTQGNILLTIIKYALPMIAGGIFSLLYNIVDTLTLGRYVGSQALAAVGAAANLFMIIRFVGQGISGGVSVIISQSFGAHDNARIRASVRGGIMLCAVVGVAVGIGVYFGVPSLLRLLGTSQAVFSQALLYLRITCGLVIASTMYACASAILRAFGNSRTPFVILVMCSIINIVLDLLFVIYFDMGVAGVAWATVIAETVSAIVCFIYIAAKYPELRGGKCTGVMKSIGSMCAIGLPMALQEIVCGVGMLVITAAINSCGDNVVAAYAIGCKVENIAIIAFANIAFSMSVFVGQNYGAKNYDRIVRGVRTTGLLIAGLCMVSTAVIFPFAEQICGFFLKDMDKLVLGPAVDMVRIEAMFYIPLGLIWMYNNTLRSVKRVEATLVSAAIELMCKIGFTIVLLSIMGYVGIWLAAPIGWVLGLIPPMIVYYRKRWIVKE